MKQSQKKQQEAKEWVPARRRQAVSLADVGLKAASFSFNRRGFFHHDIVLQWSSIVGELIAPKTFPQKIVFSGGKRVKGTLHIATLACYAVELQYMCDHILERINMHFGYQAVSRLHFVHLSSLPKNNNKRLSSV